VTEEKGRKQGTGERRKRERNTCRGTGRGRQVQQARKKDDIRHFKNEKKPGASRISQWLVGPLLGTKEKMKSYCYQSHNAKDC